MSLAAGCISLIGFSADQRDESLTFIALEDLPPGNSITFHCRTWHGSGFDITSGGSVTLSFAQGLPAGTVVNLAGLRPRRRRSARAQAG
jgi:hypothetical protein